MTVVMGQNLERHIYLEKLLTEVIIQIIVFITSMDVSTSFYVIYCQCLCVENLGAGLGRVGVHRFKTLCLHTYLGMTTYGLLVTTYSKIILKT